MTRSDRSRPTRRSHPLLSLAKAAAYATAPKFTFAALHPQSALRWKLMPYDMRHGYAPRISGAVAATLGITIGLLVGRWIGRTTTLAARAEEAAAATAPAESPTARVARSARRVTRDDLMEARARARGGSPAQRAQLDRSALPDVQAFPPARVPGRAPVNSARPDLDDPGITETW